jgi:Domain of unknown function (DUF932)
MTTNLIPAFSATGPAPHLSGRYQFYSTRDLIAPLIKDGWEVTTAFQVHSRKGIVNPHGKHLVRVTHPKLTLGEDRLEAVIRNSHDGSSKFEFLLGAWRMICSNGIIIGTEFAHATISHLRAFEYVQEMAEELIEHAPQVAEVFDAWKCRQTSQDERHALAVAASFIRWGEESPVKPETLLEVRRDEDHSNDLWTVFNRLQEALITGGTLRDDRRHVRPIRAIDETVRINKRLWGAAEALYRTPSDLVLPA